MYETEILNERESTHGDYQDTANFAQELKTVIREALSEKGKILSSVQSESLDMICSKIARVISGDHNCKDTWEDIAGYAKLVSERLPDAD